MITLRVTINKGRDGASRSLAGRGGQRTLLVVKETFHVVPANIISF